MMECNVCGNETDTIIIICPKCDDCKDRQITALQAMNVAWKEYSYAMQRYYQSLKWGSSEITSKALAEFGRTQEVLRKMGAWKQEEGR